MKIIFAIVAAQFTAAGAALAQTPARVDSISAEVSVQEAIAANPLVRAARIRVEAARARAMTSGLRPDPTFMAGLLNVPVRGAPFEDFMTMKMIGISQNFPLGGKRGVRRSIAELEVEVAAANADAAARDVERDVKAAYYELAFLAAARDIVKRNQDLLVTFIRVAEARYSAGLTGQQDALKAQVEASSLAGTAVELSERERSLRARLSSLTGNTAATVTAIPDKIRRAAVGQPNNIHFESPALGSRVADSPLPELGWLQEAALRNNPELRAQTGMVAAQLATLQLTRRERIPDIDVSLQYGQRDGYPDMVSAAVSVPIPLQRRRMQKVFIKESEAELGALQFDRDAKANAIRADVARLVSEIERTRAQLALIIKIILPQSRASLNSSLASYEVGKSEFLGVLDAQASLFKLETEYARLLSDFATGVAELERITGMEVVR